MALNVTAAMRASRYYTLSSSMSPTLRAPHMSITIIPSNKRRTVSILRQRVCAGIPNDHDDERITRRWMVRRTGLPYRPTLLLYLGSHDDWLFTVHSYSRWATETCGAIWSQEVQPAKSRAHNPQSALAPTILTSQTSAQLPTMSKSCRHSMLLNVMLFLIVRSDRDSTTQACRYHIVWYVRTSVSH